MGARELVIAQFKVPVRPVVDRLISSVGTTATRIFRQDPDRLGFLVSNLSGAAMFLGPFVDPSASKGVRLGANGGSARAHYEEDFESVAWEWFIIADAAASNLTTIEYIAE